MSYCWLQLHHDVYISLYPITSLWNKQLDSSPDFKLNPTHFKGYDPYTFIFLYSHVCCINPWVFAVEITFCTNKTIIFHCGTRGIAFWNTGTFTGPLSRRIVQVAKLYMVFTWYFSMISQWNLPLPASDFWMVFKNCDGCFLKWPCLEFWVMPCPQIKSYEYITHK